MVLYKHSHGTRKADMYNNPSGGTFKVTKKVETVKYYGISSFKQFSYIWHELMQFSHMMKWAIYWYTKLYTGIPV